MNVIFRSNDQFSNKCLRTLGGAEKWLESLSDYLSEDAILRLTVMIEKFNFEASLNIEDRGLHIYTKDSNANEAVAINSVINKATMQLVKKKEKSLNREPLIAKEITTFNKLDEKLEMDSETIHAFEIVEAENRLNEQKETPKYERVTSRYVDYLYELENLDVEIDRAEKQLNILFNILVTEKDDMLYREVCLLIDSIDVLQKQIMALTNCRNTYKLNNRDERYIDDVINQELQLLKLKRQ